MFCGVLFPEADNKNFRVDYNRDSGLYNVAYFNDGHFVDECRFRPCLEAEEINLVYVVYGWKHDDNGKIIEEWVEDIFDNEEQADAYVEYLHLTEKRKELFYFVGNRALHINDSDYITKLKKLKNNT